MGFPLEVFPPDRDKALSDITSGDYDVDACIAAQRALKFHASPEKVEAALALRGLSMADVERSRKERRNLGIGAAAVGVGFALWLALAGIKGKADVAGENAPAAEQEDVSSLVMRVLEGTAEKNVPQVQQDLSSGAGEVVNE